MSRSVKLHTTLLSKVQKQSIEICTDNAISQAISAHNTIQIHTKYERRFLHQ